MSGGSIELGSTQTSYEIKLLLLTSPGPAAANYVKEFNQGASLGGCSLFATTGLDFYTRTMRVDAVKHEVSLWRVSGLGRFDTITSRFIKGYGALVALYDPADRKSFLAIQGQLRAIQNGAGEECRPVILVAYSFTEAAAKVTAADKEAFEKEFSPKASIDVSGATPAQKAASMTQAWQDIAIAAKQYLSKQRKDCVDLTKPDAALRSGPCCS